MGRQMTAPRSFDRERAALLIREYKLFGRYTTELDAMLRGWINFIIDKRVCGIYDYENFEQDLLMRLLKHIKQAQLYSRNNKDTAYSFVWTAIRFLASKIAAYKQYANNHISYGDINALEINEDRRGNGCVYTASELCD